MLNKNNDSLVAMYDMLREALYTLNIDVYDDLPDASHVKKKLPAANISCVSAPLEKAFMREFEPHRIINQNDGTFAVITETARFDYVFDVSFFADKRGMALWLATKFMIKIELADNFLHGYQAVVYTNAISIAENKINGLAENIQVLLKSPPTPPVGEPDMYMSVLSLCVRGKLLTCEIVPEFDIKKFKIKAVPV